MILGQLFVIAAAVSSATNPVIENYDQTHTTFVARVEGQYLPLINKALAHPRMRGRRLDCYDVSVIREEGAWHVYFAGHREPMPPDTETEIHVGFMPQNPLCPDIGFIFDAKGRIERFYLSRE